MSEMQIRTFGQTAEIATPTRDQIVVVMKELTMIGRKRRNDPEYLATYAAAKEFATETAQGKAEAKLDKAVRRISTAGRFRRARISLAID